MQNNQKQISGMHSASNSSAAYKSKAIFLVFVLHILVAALAGATAFGLIPGAITIVLFAVIGMVALAWGLTLKSGSRISAVFGVFAFAGLIGVILAMANFNLFFTLVGIGLAGFSILALSKIQKRGWNHA